STVLNTKTIIHMRKFASFFAMLMLFSVFAFAQNRTVKGTVKDNNGIPVSFATITEAGTQNGTTADVNGAFSLSIKEGSRLEISSAGFNTITVTPTAGDMEISLGAATGELQEVVVTALGIKRDQKALGYAVSQLDPNE